MTDYFLDSSQFDVLSITGADATRFLQGQVTCDVQALEPGSCTPGAALTNKGRVYALFFLLRVDDGFVIVLPPGIGAVFEERLRKYLPFYKCQFNAGAAHGSVLLVAGSDAVAGTDEADIRHCRLDNAGHLSLAWLAPGVDESHMHGLEKGTWDRWQLDAMLGGHFPFTVEDVDVHTTQDLRLEHHGYVSFDKGCYTGQEIVARMHYRGKPKKALCRMVLSLSPQESPTGVTLLDGSGAVLGDMMRTLPLGNDRYQALAFLSLDALADSSNLRSSIGSLSDVQPL